MIFELVALSLRILTHGNRDELTVKVSLCKDTEDDSNAEDASCIAFIARKKQWNSNRRQVSVLSKVRDQQYWEHVSLSGSAC